MGVEKTIVRLTIFFVYKRIIARLDIKNGILVKGIGLEGLRNLGNPEYFSNIYYNKKIDEIHFQDVVASLYDRKILYDVIEKNCKTIFVNISVGGGVRNENEADKLFRIGADKISVNTAAVKDPNFLERLVKIYGSSSINVNIDTIRIGNKYEVLIETGRERTGLELFRWIDRVQDLNVGEITVTDILSEGRKKGFNLSLYKDLRKRINIQLVAHGGAGTFDDIKELFLQTNVDAVSLSSILHYNYLKKSISNKVGGNTVFMSSFENKNKNKNIIQDLKLYLNKNGILVRI
jgi:cyclase